MCNLINTHTPRSKKKSMGEYLSCAKQKRQKQTHIHARAHHKRPFIFLPCNQNVYMPKNKWRARLHNAKITHKGSFFRSMLEQAWSVLEPNQYECSQTPHALHTRHSAHLDWMWAWLDFACLAQNSGFTFPGSAHEDLLQHDGSPQRSAAAGFSTVGALGVADFSVVGGVVRASAARAVAGTAGAVGVSAVGSAARASAARAEAGTAGAVGVSATDPVVRASTVRVVSCTAAEGVSAGATLSSEAGCCPCTEKNDVIERGAAAGV